MNKIEVCAIHQPDFFPWIGYFHKISQVDTLVIFDHVQITRGKSWSSRNKILLNAKEQWLTMPIKRSGHSLQTIRETEINYNNNFTRKHLGTLKQAYGKTAFFNEIYSELEKIYSKEYRYLIDFNIDFIKLVADKINLNLNYISSYDLIKDNKDILKLSKNDLVLALTKEVQCSKYISGTGCLDFILPESFTQEGIEFVFQTFSHPIYTQKNNNGEFISHLSALDALFNLGFLGFEDLIKNHCFPKI